VQVKDGEPPFAPTVLAVGDEFTKSDQLADSYTSLLKTQLKSITEIDWDVKNFGNPDNGAVIQKADHPYWFT